MNDAWGYDETDNELPNANGPKALRDYAKSQKERADAAEARIAAVEQQLRRAQVGDLFESQGVPRSAAQYYNGDADPEKVTSWVNDMRSAFGGAAAPQAQQAPQSTVSPTDQAQIQQMMQAGADGAVPGNYDVAMKQLNDPTLSTADRVAAWNQLARNQQQG
jgi:hypothetical protein